MLSAQALGIMAAIKTASKRIERIFFMSQLPNVLNDTLIQRVLEAHAKSGKAAEDAKCGEDQHPSE